MPLDFEGRDLSAIEIHIPGLRRYARLLMRGEPSRADDLVEEALKRALFRRDRRRDGGGDPRVWLYAILHRRHRRHAKARSASRGIGTDPQGIGGPARSNFQLDLMRAFSRLPDGERAALYLVGVENFSYDEAATILDVPVGMLIARLSRGRESLRQYCGRAEPDPAGASPAIA